jgi:hypothetical protein
MKYSQNIILTLLFCFPLWLFAQVEVTYSLEYDTGTEVYTVSMTSNTTYNPPLSRMTNSTQATLVIPQIVGGWQVSNFNNLTALQWGISSLDGSSEGLGDDYLFFAPGNAGIYTPFLITANTSIPLFSFQSGSGCVGNLSLYDNANDPLNGVPTINGGNNIVILGAGPVNAYSGNATGDVSCIIPCAADAGTLSY